MGSWLSQYAHSPSDLGLRAESIQVLHVVAPHEHVVFLDVVQDEEHVRVDGLGIER